jgi:hypothetical protein
MKYVVVTFALVAGGLLAVIVAGSGQGTASIERRQDLMEGKNVAKPNEIQLRTGIPQLTSFENDYSNATNYHAVNEGQYGYLDRAIKKGTALISNSEMDEYFKIFSDNGYRFAVTSKDGITKYYTINYFEPPISLDRHNILISVKDKLDSSRKDLSQAEKAFLSEAIEKPYRWTQIDENAASALVMRIAADGYEGNIATDGAQKTVRVMYIGPLSEELKLPEFQAMYGQVAGTTGGQ